MGQKYTLPDNATLDEKIHNFRRAFDHTRTTFPGLDEEVLITDIRVHMMHFVERIRYNMSTSGLYGAAFREEAFGQTLVEMIKVSEQQQGTGTPLPLFYHKQQMLWGEDIYRHNNSFLLFDTHA